jgi:hypothetical protein
VIISRQRRSPQGFKGQPCGGTAGRRSIRLDALTSRSNALYLLDRQARSVEGLPRAHIAFILYGPRENGSNEAAASRAPNSERRTLPPSPAASRRQGRNGGVCCDAGIGALFGMRPKREDENRRRPRKPQRQRAHLDHMKLDSTLRAILRAISQPSSSITWAVCLADFDRCRKSPDGA